MKIICRADCNFAMKDIVKGLGLNERGRVQNAVANEVLRLSDEYVPFREGALRASGHVENDSEVVWRTPYAAYMWNGIVYEDPQLHCAGFETENGWRSRKFVQKVPTDRSINYGGGFKRGAQWVYRMLEQGGRKIIEAVARKAAGR